MKLEVFAQISFILDKQAYYPGDLINGAVNFFLENRTQIDSLMVKLVGYAKVKWSNKLLAIKRSKDIEDDYKAVENYINIEKYLIPKQNQHDLYLECGNHTYEFKFDLAEKLPSSFEHPLGRIIYKLILIGEISSKSVDIYSQPFSVVNALDLNRHRYLKQPNSIKITKQTRSMLGTSRGTQTLTLTLSQSGYVPGQIIPFGLIVSNDSNRLLKHVYVYLIQQVYIQTSAHMRIVSKFKLNRPVAKGQTEIIKDGFLEIPAVCESFSRNLIKVNYIIMVRVNKRDCEKVRLDNDYLTIPIFIGTKPFFGDFDDLSCACFKPCIFGMKTMEKNKDKENNEIDGFIPYYLTYYNH